MLGIIVIVLTIAFLSAFVVCYLIFRADRGDKLFLKQPELTNSSATEKKSFKDLSQDIVPEGTTEPKSGDSTLRRGIGDNVERRSGFDRRQFSYADPILKTRGGPDRESGRDQRSESTVEAIETN
jgi:hypothetical protein